ncbi:hypothetical protein SAMN05192529_11180 [Arachidicoccus rhizosphaerae]|uniref:CarboxypepD_reg-like domain-containing protein n=1 Tax=Arachidicoccus rhizosphaerae TaxID=551991 RepID=A0A1H3ZKI9_9BACT|nr:hypothetical protein [Arachidicoccus rhizosphaerae]SEA24158.1 hypothetical protein SAMN05192529_11180 [Arachidicoccus rhizosphaerae]
MYKLFVIISVCLLSFSASAQESYIYGYIKDSLTDLPIQDVHVSGNREDTSDYTNSSGLFVIKAAKGDTLTFLRVGYFSKKLVLSEGVLLDTLRLAMTPKTHELESVTVSAYNYADYQADSADRIKYFEQAIGYNKPLFDKSNTGAGLGISLDRIFSRKEKNKKRAFVLFKEVEQEKYVDFRFNSILVHSYTGFKGDKLQRFMNKYRPSYNWLRQHNRQVDLLYYINDKLKRFR